MKIKTTSLVIIAIYLILGIPFVVLTIFGCTEPQKESQDDKAAKVVIFLEDLFNTTENTGGKMTCEARKVGKDLVQCDLHFHSNMDNLSVIANTKGIAEANGQAGLAATIYFTGWKGKLKVCEYKWDMYSQMVSRVN